MADDLVTVEALRRLVAEFVEERAWQGYHAPKSLSMSIAIEAAELMEHFQWLDNEASHKAAQAPEVRAALAGELADVIIYCLALANAVELDVSAAVAEKMAHNRRRFPTGELPSRYRPAGL
jgi:NTP pyrophosphatase (non-canonical NTP hydrolase)